MVGLILAAHLVATAPTTQIAPGTYTYEAMLAGAKVGTSTLTVKDLGGSIEIDEQASGAMSGSTATANSTLLLGADLAPVSYRLNATDDGSPLRDSATIDDTTADVTNVHGTKQSFDLPASAKHFVVVDFGSFAGFLPLPAQMRAWDDAVVYAVVPSMGRTVTLTPQSSTSEDRPTDVPAGDASISFGGEAPFTVWYDPSTNVPDEIDFTMQGLTVTRQR
ncbi:MAG TPA: hypothetical protein VMF11_09955 [Candidatus Baltobacteraceae bacterium]|nr:hypothetical protein [Candidatus Baltobacteraceae bacterium]